MFAPRDDMVKVNVDVAVRAGNSLGVSAIVFPHISDLATLESSTIRVALALTDNLYE